MKASAPNVKSYVVAYGNEQYVVNPGQPLTLKAGGKASVRVLQKSGGTERLLDNVLVIKRGNNVVLKYPDGIEVVLQDYVSECRKDDECVVSLPTKEGAEYGLSGADFDMASYPDDLLLYAHGDQSAVMQMAGENGKWTEVLSSLDQNEITYLYAESSQSNAYFIGGLAAGLAALGGAVAASGKGGGGGSSPAAPSTDTMAPVAPTPNIELPQVVSLTSISDDIYVVGDFITSDNTLVFNGSVRSVLKSGQRVQVSLDSGGTWHDAVTTDTSWSYDNTATPLADGSYTVKARIVDLFGNTTGAENVPVTIVIDATTPTSESSFASIYSDTGISTTDFVTNDQTLVISGALSQELALGQKAQISFDNGVTWGDVTGTGTAWTYSTSTLPEGVYQMQTRTVNAIGTDSKWSGRTLTIDITPPHLSVNEATSMLLSGITEKESVIKISSNSEGGFAQTINIGDTGEWQWLPQGKISEGGSLTITSTDLAGNSSVMTGVLLNNYFTWMPLGSAVIV